MHGIRDPNLPEWSFNASKHWKSNGFIVQLLRAKPFGGIFKSEQDVVRFFEERGVKITGVSVDPDPYPYLDQEICEKTLERFARFAKTGKADMGKESIKDMYKFYNRHAVDFCGFIIDGFEEE